MEILGKQTKAELVREKLLEFGGAAEIRKWGWVNRMCRGEDIIKHTGDKQKLARYLVAVAGQAIKKDPRPDNQNYTNFAFRCYDSAVELEPKLAENERVKTGLTAASRHSIHKIIDVLSDKCQKYPISTVIERFEPELDSIKNYAHGENLIEEAIAYLDAKSDIPSEIKKWVKDGISES